MVRLESGRPISKAGRGRQRIGRQQSSHAPDRIVVGEVRGEEAFDMLQAMKRATKVVDHGTRQLPSRRHGASGKHGLDGQSEYSRARDVEQISSAVHAVAQIARLS